jgi:hypothetical protein
MTSTSTPNRAPLEGVVAAVAGKLGEKRRVGVDVVWLAVTLTPVMVADLSWDGTRVTPGYAWTLGILSLAAIFASLRYASVIQYADRRQSSR